MYYMGVSYLEAYNIPVWQRKWFIQRINDEFAKAAKAQSGQLSKAAHTNTPEARALMGKSSHQVPAKLRRFT